MRTVPNCFAAALLLLLGVVPVRSDPESEGELLEDPPGISARPRPGAPPEAPITFGAFSSVQVNVDAKGANIPGDAANEPSIAVDPIAPNRMAIGWRQFDTITSNFRQAGYAWSIDGGRTWTASVLDPGVFRSDPVLDFDATGVFYYSSLQTDFTVDVYTSLDHGASWLAPVDAFGGDKQWLGVDRTSGIGAGHLYQFWNVFAGCCGDRIFTRSTDGAVSFEEPILMNPTPRRGALTVGPDGTAYFAGMDPSDASVFYAVRSADAQNAAVTPTFQSASVDLGGSLVRPVNDFGWPNPNGLNGQVWVAADHSLGPTAGYVYELCSVDPSGSDPMDVRFARSQNGGVTWSPSKRVNDDPLSAGSFQWFGTMAVAPGGRIDVVWNDTRDTGVPNESALFYSSSTDGGTTWSADQQLSPTWDSHVGFPNQNKIGDYYHMISDDVGAHLAWAATFHGEQDVYYLRIGDYDCNTNGVADSLDIANGTSPDVNENGIPDECEPQATDVADLTLGSEQPRLLRRTSPNPFTRAATIEIDLPRAAASVRLRVFDATGRAVRTLLSEPLPAGPHRIEWDGRDAEGGLVPSGVYFTRIEAGARTDVRRMVLVR
jgi:hypothetical protein